VNGNQEKIYEKSIASHFKSNLHAFTKAPRNTYSLEDNPGRRGNEDLGKTIEAVPFDNDEDDDIEDNNTV
jgi:hypothetical protein